MAVRASRVFAGRRNTTRLPPSRPVCIPVVANGDIDSPQVAKQVLRATGVDAVMIGRAALGRPWIFRAIAHYLATGHAAPPPPRDEVRVWLQEHLSDHYALYGEYHGVRSARKHLLWYLRALVGCPAAQQRLRDAVNTVQTCQAQWDVAQSIVDSADLLQAV